MKKLLFAILLIVLSMPLAHPAAQAQSSNFSAPSLVDTLPQVVSLAFTPDQSMLFAITKDGKLYTYDIDSQANLTRRLEVALDLSAHLCEESERGLLGIAVDPSFTSNRYIYLFYTYDKGITGSGRCDRNTDGSASTAQTPVNRVSRFTFPTSGQINLSSEKVLIDNIPSNAGNHNAGDLHFGKDGYLYISTGDGGCDYNGGGCGGSNNASRDIHILLGKILRIDPGPIDAANRVPASNPFAASGITCALTGAGTAGKHCRETYAYGLRNPFRMAFDPNASTTRFFLNDVGQNNYEEIDLGEAAVDYRWNICEGFHITNSSNLCPAPDGQERNPIHEYAHNEAAANGNVSTNGCTSITAASFIPKGQWPSSYDKSYLFADYVCGKIFELTPDTTSGSYIRKLLSADAGAVVDMDFGPGPNAAALYLADIGSGEIKRILLLDGANLRPNAIITAQPRYGSLTVNFDGSASSDPNGDSLTYEWDFGDGQTQTTSTATIVHTYASHGHYTITLNVRDPSNMRSDAATVVIQTDDTAPVPTIERPAAGSSFKVGQIITLRGSASDAEDGTIPDAGLRWTVILHHRDNLPGDHTHPFLGPITGNNLTFEAPAPEDLDAASNSYLEIRLTAVDKVGAETTVIRNIMPKKVMVTLKSSIPSMPIEVNGAMVQQNVPFVSWEGYELHTNAPLQHPTASRWLVLRGWSDGTTTSQLVLKTPASDRTYTAVFGDADLAFLPVARR